MNIVTRALVVLGQLPDDSLILRYVTNIGELYQRYVEYLVDKHLQELRSKIENGSNVLKEKELALSSEAGKKLCDPILEGLRSAVRYDRTYFDKIVASLLPLLDKLTIGKTAALLSPDYEDIDDSRPIMTGNR